ncbi:hypothetical protein D3C84_807150 [compost metagenome]
MKDSIQTRGRIPVQLQANPLAGQIERLHQPEQARRRAVVITHFRRQTELAQHIDRLVAARSNSNGAQRLDKPVQLSQLLSRRQERLRADACRQHEPIDRLLN